MATIYVKSGAGNVSPFATWANAATTLQGAFGVAVAGDIIYVSQAHSESSAVAQTYTSAGTAASPIRVICANDGATPPTATATTAVVTTTGGSAITMSGVAYFYGIQFQVATGAVTSSFTLASVAASKLVFEQCLMRMNGTSASLRMTIGVNASSLAGHVIFRDTDIQYSATGQGFLLQNARVEWLGGSLLGSALTTLVNVGNGGRAGNMEIEGVDLSIASSSVRLAAFANGLAYVDVVNCKMPVSWDETLCTAVMPVGSALRLFNSDNGATNYKLNTQNSAGTVKTSTSVYASDWSGDDTPHSYVMASNSAANEWANILESPNLYAPNSTVGSAVTVSVEVVADNVTLTDAEAWLEVLVMDTTGNPLGNWTSDRRSTPLTTAANQTTNTSTWVTTGLTTPVKQTLSVSVTPQRAGYMLARVMLAKASTTVYVDPTVRLA